MSTGTNPPKDSVTTITDDDPGLIIKLEEPAQVHACLAMPSVANIDPPLDQGKKENTIKL